MKKNVFAMLMLLLSVVFGHTEETTKRETFEPGTKDGDTFEYIDWFYEDSELVRSEYVFKDEHINEYGRIRQINYYNSSKQIWKYDSQFSEEYGEKWGILGLVEVYDGEVPVQFEYHFTDGSVITFNGKDLDMIQRYSPKLLFPDIAFFLNHQETEPSHVYMPGWPSSSIVTIDVHSLTIADEAEINHMKEWALRRNFGDFSSEYERRITAIQNEITIHLFLHESITEEIITHNRILIFSNYIGGSFGQDVTLVAGYIPVE